MNDNKDFPDHAYLDEPFCDSGCGTAFSTELVGKNSVQYTRSDLTLSQDEMQQVLDSLRLGRAMYFDPCGTRHQQIERDIKLLEEKLK